MGPAMTTHRLVEAAEVVSLFVGYLALWRLKRHRDRRRTGVDPEVIHMATTPVQRYFARLLRVMTGLVVLVIGLHAGAPDAWPPFVRVAALDPWWFDVAGAVLGVAGLAVCAAAQATMGSAWRVGIDVERRTDLVTGGIYRRVRNPTYLGLHLVNLGLWFIWPTTLVASFAVLFFVVMELQVRAEEEHLVNMHGEAYRAYAGRSWRYIPWIY